MDPTSSVIIIHSHFTVQKLGEEINKHAAYCSKVEWREKEAYSPKILN